MMRPAGPWSASRGHRPQRAGGHPVRLLQAPGDLPAARHALVDALRNQRPWIRDADMYWVSADMTKLALDASHDLPDWSAGTAMPSPQGLLYWAGPLPALTVQLHPLPLAGVLWVPCRDQPRHQPPGPDHRYRPAAKG